MELGSQRVNNHDSLGVTITSETTSKQALMEKRIIVVSGGKLCAETWLASLFAISRQRAARVMVVDGSC
jgi:hypothetical protein